MRAIFLRAVLQGALWSLVGVGYFALTGAGEVVPEVTVQPHTVSLSGTADRKTLQGHCREPLTGPVASPTWTWTVRNPAIIEEISSGRSAVTLVPLANGSTYIVGACSGDSDSALATVTGIGGGGGSFGDPTGELARMADSLVESISVQTHMTYAAYENNWTNIIKPRLIGTGTKLGVRHIRERMFTDATARARIQEMADSGVKLTAGCWPNGGVYTDASHCLSRAADYGANTIDAFDGWNEVDNKLASWTGPWVQFQTALWNAYNGNNTWKDKPLLANSLAAAGAATTLFNAEGNQSSRVDFGNMHSYPAGSMPSVVDNSWIPNWNTLVGPKKLAVTETGYHTCLTCGGNGVSQLAQAKYLGRLLFEYFNREIWRTSIYELFDEGVSTTSREDNWGLIQNNGTVKTSFTTIKNIISILNDPGAPFTPGRLNYSLTGALSTTHHTLLQKRNGDFYLVLWREVSSWNISSKTDITNSDDALTLSMGTAADVINVYNPRLGTGVQQTGSGTSIALNVPDEVLIVEILR